MKPAQNARRQRKEGGVADNVLSRSPLERHIAISEIYALLFGLFLGLSILKFGNPIILNDKIPSPNSLREAFVYFWPPLWGVWLLIPLVVAAVWIVFRSRSRWPGSIWLGMLPLVWFGWQLVSGTRTVDKQLTVITLWHFLACLALYYIGAFVLGRKRGLNFLFIGVFAAFTYCLVRAVDQRLFEFPREREMLVEGQNTGWTNFPPGVFFQLKQEAIIVSTNGVNVANPSIMAKYNGGRVNGTMVYPNALASLILLLFPVTVTLGFRFSRQLKKPIQGMLLTLVLFLGLGSLFWTGSKSGWLIATALSTGTLLLYLPWSFRAKLVLTLSLTPICLLAFALRFSEYFASGATSVVARFDYWSVAMQIVRTEPLLGSGPGTFQRPYALLKPLNAEMARLVHNDYLEQFSDSGVIGGLSYVTWACLLLGSGWRRIRASRNPVHCALFVGLLGWFIHGLTEFGLYVPALAWSGFALAGSVLSATGNRFDRPSNNL